jgi:hypothetical protein
MPDGTKCVSNDNAAAAKAGTTADRDDQPNPAAEAYQRIKRDLDELKEYGSYYLSAKIDGFKTSIRNLGLYAVLGVLGLIVGGAVIATAAGLIVIGVGQLLGELFGNRFWLGYLVTGVVILSLVGAGAWMMLNKLTSAWRSATLKKYEQRKQTQRIRFGGHNVADRAAATGHRDLTQAAGGAVADGASSAKAGGPGGQKGH